MLRLRTFWLGLLAALAMTLTVANAFAQTVKVREELPADLRDNWDAAGELFDDGNYEAALGEYQQIYKASQNPRVLYNVGVCWKERKYYAQAAGAFEKQLTSKAKLPKAEADRAESALETVRAFVTTLEVESNQPGARLFIKDIEVGKTPVAGTIAIDVGPNKLVLEKEGYAKVERTIDVPKGKPVKIVLNMVKAEKTARAKISVAGAEGATIFIDGTDMGPAPFEGEVPTGRHTFEARLKGYVPGRQTSEVEYGQAVKVSLSLTTEINEGKIRIRTGHPDATIIIDGKQRGTGTWEGLLPAGGHQLEVKKSGYKTHRQEVALVGDQDRVVDVKLESDNTSSWIYWTVTGVLVAAGAATTFYFVLKPAEAPQVTGTFDPGVVPTFFRF